MADLALAVFPAEVDLAAVAEVKEIDQAETEILGRGAALASACAAITRSMIRASSGIIDSTSATVK